MKQIILVLSCLSLVLCFSAPVVLVGCHSTPQTVAYKSLKSVTLAAEAARVGYNNRRRDGNISPAQEARALPLWEHYQTVMLAAIETARMDYSAPVPEDVQNAVTAFINAVNSFNK